MEEWKKHFLSQAIKTYTSIRFQNACISSKHFKIRIMKYVPGSVASFTSSRKSSTAKKTFNSQQ